jgi:alpha-tubulin suppressor-like RCC1 family protein
VTALRPVLVSIVLLAACGPEEEEVVSPRPPTKPPVDAAAACPAGRVTCGSAACDTDVTTSPAHCGTCGHACDAGQICRASACRAPPQRIAAGNGHTCWLTGGSVACWGANGSGQLGQGDERTRNAPALVRGIDDAVDVAAGGSVTCVLRSSGHVSCWGANGSGATCGSPLCGESTEVFGVRDAVRLAVGGSHACAVLTSGALVCWGQGESGQLGVDAGASSPDGHPPTVVAGIDDAFGVSAGSRSTCVLRKNGEVSCFGLDDRGRLGDSRTTSEDDAGVPSESKPRGAGPVPGLTDVIALASSGPRTCAARRDGSVVCWGGLVENTRPGDEKVAPAPVEGVSDAHRVALSESGLCVLHDSGEVSCVNRNPRKMPDLRNATAIAEGNGYTCVTRLAGRPVCWGTNADGALGIGESAFFDAPTAAEGIDDAVEVETTEYGTCARRSSGHVSCWGGGSEGWKPVEVPGITDATHLWGGFTRTCASRASGVLTCFAAGHSVALDPRSFDVPGNPSRVAARGIPGVALRDGQLFYFDETGRDKKTSVIQGVGDVIAVHASYGEACAVQKNGAVVCWSAPANRTPGRAVTPTLRRIKVDPAIDVGGYSSWCALLRSGELGCFGGSNDELSATTERGVNDAVSVRASGTSTCALLASGDVWCSGMLYGAGASERWMQRGVVQGIRDAVSVGIASHHACVATRAGKVFCWGWNAGGLLARHERGSSDTPLEVLAPATPQGPAE